MHGHIVDLEQESITNEDFRRVIYTATHSQLVLMSLKPGEDIGMETHPDNDQFIRLDAGEGKVILDGAEYPIKSGYGIVIPAGTEHNIINTGTEAMKIYTVYSPPHHQDGILRQTKEQAETQPEEFDGQTSQ